MRPSRRGFKDGGGQLPGFVLLLSPQDLRMRNAISAKAFGSFPSFSSLIRTFPLNNMNQSEGQAFNDTVRVPGALRGNTSGTIDSSSTPSKWQIIFP